MSFDHMIETCKEALSDLECPSKYHEPQVTVLLGASGKVYIAENDFDGNICRELTDNDEAKIIRLVTMWKDSGIDQPSEAFKIALCQWNRECLDAEILMRVNYSDTAVKKLRDTISSKSLAKI